MCRYWFFGIALWQSPLRVDRRSGVDISPGYLLHSSTSRLLLAYYFPIMSLVCSRLASRLLHSGWRSSRNGRLGRSLDHHHIFAQRNWPSEKMLQMSMTGYCRSTEFWGKVRLEVETRCDKWGWEYAEVRCHEDWAHRLLGRL